MTFPFYHEIQDQMQSWIGNQSKINSRLIREFSWIPLNSPPSIEKYKNWLNRSEFGEMNYLAEHLPQKEKPNHAFPQFKSAIVFIHDYLPHPYPHQLWKHFRIAQYAMGLDYHHWIKALHHDLIQQLKLQFPNFEAQSMVDSGPVIERDLAAQAGLGWIGKNSMLIHPKRGSFHFISEILTNIAVPESQTEIPDFCGTCNRCVEACPTSAIGEDRTLVADKCISYLTIETRKPAPLPLRKKMGDSFFGCDICQNVCPWNQKVFGKDLETTALRALNETEKNEIAKEAAEILGCSNHSLNKKLKGTALSRAGAKGLFKNTLIVIANQNLRSLIADVENFKSRCQKEKWSELEELSNWCLQELNQSSPNFFNN